MIYREDTKFEAELYERFYEAFAILGASVSPW